MDAQQLYSACAELFAPERPFERLPGFELTAHVGDLVVNGVQRSAVYRVSVKHKALLYVSMPPQDYMVVHGFHGTKELLVDVQMQLVPLVRDAADIWPRVQAVREPEQQEAGTP